MVCLCGAVRKPAGSGGGEDVYNCVCGWELLLCVGWLSLLFEFMKQWLP